MMSPRAFKPNPVDFPARLGGQLYRNATESEIYVKPQI